MPRQSVPKSNFRCKSLIVNRITALSRFAESFQNLSNHFKIVADDTRHTPQLPYSFIPNDKRLVFHVVPTGSGGLQVWTVPLESGSTGLRAGKPEPFLQTQFNERDPSFSPDGRWLAYNSDQSGSYQVYVQAF